MKLLEVLERVDRKGFEFMFGRELTYTTVLSDQRMVELIPNGSNTAVRYEDRKEFIRLVQKARLEESKEQVTLFPRADRLQGNPAPVASHPGTCGIYGCQNQLQLGVLCASHAQDVHVPWEPLLGFFGRCPQSPR